MHTFLLREGRWTARGTYTDETGRELPLEGWSEITHAPARWRNRSAMTIASHVGPVEFASDYDVEPFAEGRTCTRWTSFNPALGELHGQFVLVGDTILSAYQTEDGRVRGVEAMRRIDDDRYEARGGLLEEGRRVSSWTASLVRMADGEAAP